MSFCLPLLQHFSFPRLCLPCGWPGGGYTAIAIVAIQQEEAVLTLIITFFFSPHPLLFQFFLMENIKCTHTGIEINAIMYSMYSLPNFNNCQHFTDPFLLQDVYSKPNLR
jgi:hypothetical protein